METARRSLTKREILRGYQAFSRVIAGGRSLQKGALRCFFVRGGVPKDGVRVGFSVSRSVRTAVERNRARRWLREAYRANRHLLADSSVGDVVFMLRIRGQMPKSSEAHAEIDRAVIALLKELHQHLADEP